MRLNTRHLALIAVAASMIVPAGAAARPIEQAGGTPSPNAVSITCGTDYSKNSATGEYCVDPSTGVAPITAQPNAPATHVVAKDASFSWANAFTGAGAAIGVLLVGAGAVTLLLRRRRDSTTLVGPGSPTVS